MKPTHPFISSMSFIQLILLCSSPIYLRVAVLGFLARPPRGGSQRTAPTRSEVLLKGSVSTSQLRPPVSPSPRPPAAGREAAQLSDLSPVRWVSCRRGAPGPVRPWALAVPGSASDAAICAGPHFSPERVANAGLPSPPPRCAAGEQPPALSLPRPPRRLAVLQVSHFTQPPSDAASLYYIQPKERDLNDPLGCDQGGAQCRVMLE